MKQGRHGGTLVCHMSQDLMVQTFIYLFIYLIGANKTEHSLTDGEEQHGSLKLVEKTRQL